MYDGCRLSPKPGVPAAVSTGGAAGLPDRPRDGRGLGDSDFGGRVMRGIWANLKMSQSPGIRGSWSAGFLNQIIGLL